MSIATLHDVLSTNVAAQPDAPAITLDDRTVPWRELDESARRVASALAEAGVGSQDRVAFIDKNSIEYFELLFGATYLNAVLVAVNWRLAPPEMEYIVNDAEAKVLVIHEDFAEHLAAFESNLEHTSTIVVIGSSSDHTSWSEWVDRPAELPASAVSAGVDDVALQLYTSGTTGLPKGAQLTNANFTALLDTAANWGMDDNSASLAAMPLFHIGGSGWSLFGMANGAHTVLLRELDPVEALKIIDRHEISHAFLVPAVLQFLLMVPRDGIDLSSMRLMAYGASPITEDVLVKSMEMFQCDFIQVYGLSETTGAVVQLDPEDHDPGGPKQHLLRAAGKPMGDVELKIVDPDTGETLPDGEVGEVWIRSATNMLGYWKLPEATAESLPGDNWFRSGDAGYLQDGYLFLHDRVKDMIISGGENIYPAEIENVLMKMEAIADCAVIGVPDEKWGEVGKAIVIPVPDAEITEQEILDHCRANLAAFKCPKSVDFVAEIPRNPSGKVLKRELREPYWEGHTRQVG